MYENLVRITPDPSWKEGSKRGMHVVTIDRLKIYRGTEVRVANPDMDVEMSDNEFSEAIPNTVDNPKQKGSPPTSPLGKPQTQKPSTSPVSKPQMQKNSDNSDDNNPGLPGPQVNMGHLGPPQGGGNWSNP